MDRDFVLTNARAQHGTAQQTGQAGTADTPQRGTAGTTGAAEQGAQTQAAGHRIHADHMLKIDGKDEDELRQYANQRVEIRGTLDDRNWFERASRSETRRRSYGHHGRENGRRDGRNRHHRHRY